MLGRREAIKEYYRRPTARERKEFQGEFARKKLSD